MKALLFAIPMVFALNFYGMESPPEEAESPMAEAEPVVWHDEYQMIAHAFGIVDGYVETNSLEAFHESYEKGIRVFEGDFQMTSDGVLVLRHNFEIYSYYTLGQQIEDGALLMDEAQFRSTLIHNKYTPLTAMDLVELLLEYDDAFLVTDTKDLEENIVRAQFLQLAKCVYLAGDPSLFERIIVQIYYEDMYDIVSDVYPFEHWIFTLYQLYNPDMHEIGQFCVEKGIEVVTMPQASARLEKSEILHGYGLKVYTHTVNKSYEVRYGLNSGIAGFYTDSLLPEDYFMD